MIGGSKRREEIEECCNREAGVRQDLRFDGAFLDEPRPEGVYIAQESKRVRRERRK